jgi:hypothetical protein
VNLDPLDLHLMVHSHCLNRCYFLFLSFSIFIFYFLYLMRRIFFVRASNSSPLPLSNTSGSSHGMYM